MMREMSNIETRSTTTGVSQVADATRKAAQQPEAQRQHRQHRARLVVDQAPIRGAQPRLQTRS